LLPTYRRHRTIWIFLLVIAAALIAGLILYYQANAATAETETAETDLAAVALASTLDELPAQQAQRGPAAGDVACRLCHEDTDESVILPSGESFSAQVDAEALAASAHGDQAEEPLQCTSCHAAADYQFPHSPVEAQTLRDYELARSESCEQCHQQPHLTSHPGREAENPVVCTDCHSAHETHPADAWPQESGVDQCVECHQERDVPFTNPEWLAQVIENDLFRASRDNQYCLACHSLTDLSTTLENGDQLDLAVDEDQFHASVHGEGNPWQPLECTNCHEGYTFPHEPIVAESRRDYTLQQYFICANCHEPKYENLLDSSHGQALEEGVKEAAVCTDCHGAHDTPVPDEPRSRISRTCAQCHGTIFETYRESVHGEALLEEDNPDVAVCTDCHGVHAITDPNLAAFRNSSPELCGACHADEALMEEYDISTDVFDTYVADFHGTTVTLFETQDPDAATNKAVCYDCHGVHDIRDPDDPDAGIKERLLETCRKCHPDASENFPDAWTSHYEPSLEHNPLVFLVNWFYRIVIPATVGFLGFLVVTDVYRRARHRYFSREEE